MKKDWKKNKVVKKIITLQKTYVFRHMYAGCALFFGGGTKTADEQLQELWECSCCGTLTGSTESLYHKDPENLSGISLCSSCSSLWRMVGAYKMEENKPIITIT